MGCTIKKGWRPLLYRVYQVLPENTITPNYFDRINDIGFQMLSLVISASIFNLSPIKTTRRIASLVRSRSPPSFVTPQNHRTPNQLKKVTMNSTHNAVSQVCRIKSGRKRLETNAQVLNTHICHSFGYQKNMVHNNCPHKWDSNRFR